MWTPAQFVVVLGVGFEGANLDHTLRFAERFRAIGDEAGARLQERVGEEEIPHVRFALRWLARWTKADDFPDVGEPAPGASVADLDARKAAPQGGPEASGPVGRIPGGSRGVDRKTPGS